MSKKCYRFFGGLLNAQEGHTQLQLPDIAG